MKKKKERHQDINVVEFWKVKGEKKILWIYPQDNKSQKQSERKWNKYGW